MGVKMFEACYGAGIINLKKYKDEMNGKISCRYCGTPITYAVVNGRFCPQSVRNFCPIVAGFNAGTYKVPACVL